MLGFSRTPAIAAPENSSAIENGLAHLRSNPLQHRALIMQCPNNPEMLVYRLFKNILCILHIDLGVKNSPSDCNIIIPMDGSSEIPPSSAIQFVLLDRDGVINRKAPEGVYVHQWHDFEPMAGVETAIAALNHAKKRVLVITNQRGVALGLYTQAEVETLHHQLQRHLADHGAHIDAFYVCPHDNNQCNCRKPKTGLLEQAFQDNPDASKTNTLLIGDSLSDIQAANTFGIPSILISNQSSHKSEEAVTLATAVSPSLSDAVKTFLS